MRNIYTFIRNQILIDTEVNRQPTSPIRFFVDRNLTEIVCGVQCREFRKCA